jgi:hypothetical protein
MANDAARAVAAGVQAAQAALEAGGTPEPPFTFEDLLRELVDEQTYPRLYRLAWSPVQSDPPSEREEFLTGIGLILDGVQALIERAG